MNENPNKTLLCRNCGETTEHRYLKSEERKFEFHSTKDGKEKEADGMKDIWECCVCGATRIYGSPDDISYMAWSVLDEKHHIVSILKNFGQSRAILFCATPDDWIAGYLRGLDRRHFGFHGKELTREDKLELKIFALEQLKKTQFNRKTA